MEPIVPIQLAPSNVIAWRGSLEILVKLRLMSVGHFPVQMGLALMASIAITAPATLATVDYNARKISMNVVPAPAKIQARALIV
jgi:hypothetical protein